MSGNIFGFKVSRNYVGKVTEMKNECITLSLRNDTYMNFVGKVTEKRKRIRVLFFVYYVKFT